MSNINTAVSVSVTKPCASRPPKEQSPPFAPRSSPSSPCPLDPAFCGRFRRWHHPNSSVAVLRCSTKRREAARDFRRWKRFKEGSGWNLEERKKVVRERLSDREGVGGVAGGRKPQSATEDGDERRWKIQPGANLMLMDRNMASWAERLFFPSLLFLYLCQSCPHTPLPHRPFPPPSNRRQSVPMCGLYVMYIFFLRVILNQLQLHSCKVFYSPHKLFTFGPLYALTV